MEKSGRETQRRSENGKPIWSRSYNRSNSIKTRLPVWNSIVRSRSVRRDTAKHNSGRISWHESEHGVWKCWNLPLTRIWIELINTQSRRGLKHSHCCCFFFGSQYDLDSLQKLSNVLHHRCACAVVIAREKCGESCPQIKNIYEREEEKNYNVQPSNDIHRRKAAAVWKNLSSCHDNIRSLSTRRWDRVKVIYLTAKNVNFFPELSLSLVAIFGVAQSRFSHWIWQRLRRAPPPFCSCSDLYELIHVNLTWRT